MTHEQIDAALVSRLVHEQFPEWRSLAVHPVEIDGWDNRTFHLGDDLTVRLPSGPGYASQVDKEIRVLPIVAAGVSLLIPEIVGIGAPGAGYPFSWTVRRWIDGTPVRDVPDLNRDHIALDIAGFLHELWAIDTLGGPPPGEHSAGRGAPLQQWDEQVRSALDTLGPRVDATRARALWGDALRATDEHEPRWFHGDVAVGNLLTRDGRLSAVIDFGCAGVGDPACDLVIAWTLLGATGRDAFRQVIDVDDALWARASGWALWKALITFDDPLRAAESDFTLRQLLG